MKILLTGGSGFIGSNFILNFIENHQILNYDLITYAGSNNNLDKIKNHKNYTFQKGDIKNHELLDQVINEFAPDSIINFAAESHVDRSIDGPKIFIETNILGTYEMLNSTLKYFKLLDGNKKEDFRFIHISTDEVYGSLGLKESFLKLHLTHLHHPTQPLKHHQII